jgi:hypothetical protein
MTEGLGGQEYQHSSSCAHESLTRWRWWGWRWRNDRCKWRRGLAKCCWGPQEEEQDGGCLNLHACRVLQARFMDNCIAQGRRILGCPAVARRAPALASFWPLLASHTESKVARGAKLLAKLAAGGTMCRACWLGAIKPCACN